MGFLDRLVGDMIQSGTGYNARGLVRMVGGKRLLMLGGAAVAGGMLASQGMRSATSAAGASGSGRNVAPPRSSSHPTVAPPDPPPSLAPDLPPLPQTQPALPPLPGAAGPPTVVPAEETVADPPPEVLFAIVRTMVAAALADGELAAAEKELIDGRLQESSLSRAQIDQVRRDLIVPASVSELVALLPEGEDRETLARFAILVTRADGELSQRESSWLASFAAALGLGPARLSEIEQEIFPD